MSFINLGTSMRTMFTLVLSHAALTVFVVVLVKLGADTLPYLTPWVMIGLCFETSVAPPAIYYWRNEYMRKKISKVFAKWFAVDPAVHPVDM